MTPAPRTGEAGFTIVEAAVALALLALLAALMPSALSLARRSYQTGQTLDRRAADTAAMDFIEQRLAESTPLFQRGEDGRLQILFTGAPDMVRFVAPVRFAATGNGLGHFEVRRGMTGGPDNGLSVTWSPVELVDGQPVPANPGRTRLLLPAATALSLRYFGLTDDQPAPRWIDAWPRADRLPDMIELTVATPNGDYVRRIAMQLRLP